MSFVTKKPITFALISIIVLIVGTACVRHFLSDSGFVALNIARGSSDVDLISALEAKFVKSNGGVRSNYISLKSQKIIPSLLDGSIDVYVGMMDIPDYYASQIKAVPIAKDGLVIVTNPRNPVSNLSRRQLVSIFARRSKNWSQLGGANKPIMLLERNRDSIEKRTIYKLLFDSLPAESGSEVVAASAQELREALLRFPNAISYMHSSELGEELKALDLDNIPATRMNISQGYFPLARTIYCYFSPKVLRDKAKMDSLRQFLEFTHSPKGQDVIASQSHISLSAAELDLVTLSNNPIVIGVAAPSEGSYRDLGRSIVDAVKLAVEEENQKGGIEGRQVELVICNDKASSTQAVSCANKFVKNNAIGVVGHLTSQASIEASKIYVQNQIIQISPGSTHPWLTERPGAHGYVFRTSGRDDQQAKLIVQTINSLAREHPLKVTVFNNGTIYGSNLATLIENEALKSGIDKVVALKSIEQDQNQYQNELEALDSDVLVFVGEYGDAAHLVKGLALSNKSNVVFIGADGTFSERFIELAGLRSEGAYIIGNTVNESSPVLEAFKQKFRKRFKTNVTAYAMNSYDSAKILLEAIKEVKVDNPRLISAAIKNISYNGVTGKISFDEIGDTVSRRMQAYRVVQGQFVKVKK